MRFLEALRRVLDPRGPLGEVVSPADVWKSRQGLPIAAPHTQRARLAAPAHIDQALAAPRFVPLSEAVDVPRDRVRQVSAYVEEHWSPVYASTDSIDLATILLRSQEQIGWRVVQQQAASTRRARLSAEQFAEVVQSASIQASDEFYNGVYPTIPGNDPVMIDGTMVRGTVITGGRTEYEQRTKGMVHWDRGFVREREKAFAEEASRPIRNVRASAERMAGEVLPMRRVLSNPRFDRRSAV